jgi:AraC-like DNA-binding protein
VYIAGFVHEHGGELQKSCFWRQDAVSAMRVQTVSAGYVRNLFAFAVERGADPARLEARSGVTRGRLDDVDARIPLSAYKRLMEAAKDACNCPALALHLGAARDFREFSVVGLIFYASASMGEALNVVNRYHRLVADVDIGREEARFQVVKRAGRLWLVDVRSEPNAFPELTEGTWSRFILETSRHFPDAAYCKAVHVTHQRPAYADEYQRLWRVPVTFEADWNAIEIEPAWLSIPFDNPSPYAFGVLSEHADRLLKALRRTQSLRGEVEARIAKRLHAGEFDMPTIAREMGLSRATLLRRLKDEGTTFDAVLNELRRKLALAYLGERKISVNEAAYLAGYSDPGAFSRAFKRWTGQSPRTWRARRRPEAELGVGQTCRPD